MLKKLCNQSKHGCDICYAQSRNDFVFSLTVAKSPRHVSALATLQSIAGGQPAMPACCGLFEPISSRVSAMALGPLAHMCVVQKFMDIDYSHYIVLDFFCVHFRFKNIPGSQASKGGCTNPTDAVMFPSISKPKSVHTAAAAPRQPPPS
jgi:hypothetical protein